MYLIKLIGLMGLDTYRLGSTTMTHGHLYDCRQYLTLWGDCCIISYCELVETIC
jgi:hypothetical protein